MEEKIEQNFKEILEFIGEDSSREGLAQTPKRLMESFKEIFSGYSVNPSEILGTTFNEGASDEMVVLKDVEFYSMCEHHLLPFYGKVSIGYIPDKKIVGISALVRLVEVFSKRLQIQENMTTQIAKTLMEVLNPKGVMVVVEAQHLCMMMRGVKQQKGTLITSAVRGIFKSDPRTREEFMGHIR
ncbi:GTP cyclohydrolase I FolE [Helicobacter valdiviensis]|uniref:GTP cyclohydrolase 1 n=1 Tax=Helicobacter valdiviensis TaxID=1458358 RepID=A0A2W6PM10_9HELI|nr:GTP cyclohydrolase I FolE [Helicobacter valdiviensis]